MERGFSLGVQTLSDVLDAQQAAYRARSESSASLYNYLREWTRLHLLAGSPAEPLVKRVHELLDQPSDVRPIGVSPS